MCAGGVLMGSDACHLCHYNPPTGPRPRVGLRFLKSRDRVAGSTRSSPAPLTSPGSALAVCALKAPPSSVPSPLGTAGCAQFEAVTNAAAGDSHVASGG